MEYSSLQCIENLIHITAACNMSMKLYPFEAVLRALGDHWSLALQLMGEMPRRRLAANEITWNTALQGLSKGLSEPRRALQLLTDVVGYSTAMKAVGWVEALRLLKEMRPRRLEANVVSCNAAMASCESLEVKEPKRERK